MSTLVDACMEGLAASGTRIIRRGEKYQSVVELEHFIGETKHELLIVNGSLEPEIWEEQVVIDSFERFLIDGKARIIVGPQKLGKFWAEHKKLRKLYEEKSVGRLSMYHIDSAPRRNYSVSDGVRVMVEEQYSNGETPEILIAHDEKIAEKLRSYFIRMVESSNP